MLFTPTCGEETDETGGDLVSDFFFLKTVARRVNISRLQSDLFRGSWLAGPKAEFSSFHEPAKGSKGAAISPDSILSQLIPSKKGCVLIFLTKAALLWLDLSRSPFIKSFASTRSTFVGLSCCSLSRRSPELKRAKAAFEASCYLSCFQQRACLDSRVQHIQSKSCVATFFLKIPIHLPGLNWSNCFACRQYIRATYGFRLHANTK